MSEPMQSTKEKLFDKAIELFSENGYENVSIKDVAAAAGITGGSLYNHYASKEEILDEIFDYFETNYFTNTAPVDDVEEALRHGAPEEVIDIIMWSFFGLPEGMYSKLVMISKIIYARFLIDERANRIFLNVMCTQNGKDMMDKFNKLVEYGRLPADFNIGSFTEIILYTHLMIGIVGVAGTFEGDIAVNKAYLKDMVVYILSKILDDNNRGDE